MGTKSTPRPDAQAPRIPTEPFDSGGAIGQSRGACPDKFRASLQSATAAREVIGLPVTINEQPDGDFIARHETLGVIGRLTGLDIWHRRCLVLDTYVGMIEEGRDSGPTVQLSRIADR